MKRSALAMAALLVVSDGGDIYADPPVPANIATWGPGSVLGQVPRDLYPAIQIDGGGNHFVALRADGRVFAWGDNSSGQCTVPDGLDDVVQVAAGGAHSAAIRSDGTLVMWGRNQFGECNVPFGIGPVTDVSLGYASTIVMTAGGERLCWGFDSFGECGPPASSAEIADMSAGGRHMIYLFSDGTVECLGAFCSTPGGLSGVMAVDAGYDHGFALRNDGTVVCVSGGGSVCAVPDGLDNIVAVAAGWEISAAVQADGAVAVWGPPKSAAAPPGLLPAVGVACSYGSVAVIEARDCNANGVDDVVETGQDASIDCNGNRIPDECEAIQHLRSRVTFPFGNGFPHALVTGPIPDASGPVAVRVSVAGNLVGVTRFVTVKLNGVAVGSLFVSDGVGCDAGAQIGEIVLEAGAFNAVRAPGQNVISVEPSGAVSPSVCELTWAMVDLRYPIEPARPDCDSNGAWDACDISQAGAADCNGNWIPDSCETGLIDCDVDGVLDVCQIAANPEVDTNGDGVLDACQYARGDFTLDGQVDGADLSLLLLLWGTINPKIGDLTGDGQINGSDLGYLLLNWGPVSF